jgi:hypothetical protein
LTSRWGEALVSTAVLALAAGTWKSHVGPRAASVAPPERPRSRQNTTPRGGRSRVGCALVPVTVSVSITLAHARSRQSSTDAPSWPADSAHRSVGRSCVTPPSESGASGRGGGTDGTSTAGTSLPASTTPPS